MQRAEAETETEGAPCRCKGVIALATQRGEDELGLRWNEHSQGAHIKPLEALQPPLLGQISYAAFLQQLTELWGIKLFILCDWMWQDETYLKLIYKDILH